MTLTFEPIASSSAGNAFIVSDGESKLLLECGLKYRDIQIALDFQTSQLDGCLLTHEHDDHSHSVKDVLKAGVSVYTSQGTSHALGLKHHRLKSIEARKQFRVGSFTVLPFETEHDANEPLGFLIESKGGERLLFATDTYFIRYRFKGINILAVECNFSEEILEQNIIDGIVPLGMKRRLLQSHFSFENYVEFLKANDLSQLKEIWLIHMSNRNADAEKFKSEIRKITGKPVYIP
jgi:phosphoribosyl 1,2-cyclic phosphodiesterase